MEPSELDSAKTRLQAAAEPRARSRAYHVFRLLGDGHFKHLTPKGPVSAASRKDAISRAATATAEGASADSFLVVAEREFKVLTRKVQRKVEEVFE
jgi:hypothetical protein